MTVRLGVRWATLAALLACAGTAELGCRAWQSWDGFRHRGSGGVFDLYVVGESTAVGLPYDPEMTPAALVADRFAGRIAGRPIRVTTIARVGESIYPQSVALERSLRRRGRRDPGAVLVYSGHNDAGDGRPTPAFERFKQRVLYRSAALRGLFFLAEKSRLLPRVRTLGTWQYHLRRVVEMSLDRGLTPVLATAASDSADIDPGLGLAPDVSRAEAVAILERGRTLESRRPEAALRYYRAQASAHPCLGRYLQYRMGKCYEALGRYQEAGRRFQEVADRDSPDSFGRATRRQNDFIRALGRQYRIPVAEVAEAFARRSPHRLTGDGLFLDGQHPNVAGYLLLAGAYAQSLSVRFREPLRRPAYSPAKAARRFSLDRERQAVALISGGRALFTHAVGHPYPRLRLDKARRRFQDAIALSPDNWSAWLGLGLTEAAQRSDLLWRQEDIDWLGRLGLFYGGGYRLSDSQASEVVGRLEALGIPRRTLRNIDRTSCSSERARQAAGSGRFERALRIYKSLIEDRRLQSADELLRLADEARRAGARPAALAALELAAGARLDAGQARRAADLCRGLGQADRALRAVRRDADYLLAWAESEVRSGRRPQALRLLGALGRLRTDGTQTLRLAELHRALDGFDAALRILGGARRRGPAQAAALLNWAGDAQRDGRPDRAARALRLAQTLGLQGVQACRAAQLRRELPEGGSAADETHRRALAYQRAGDHRRALALLDGLLRERPAQARWLSDRGVIKSILGRREDAARDLEAALRLDPGLLPAAMSLGALYAASGRKADAARLYERALAQPSCGAGDERLRRRFSRP
ncbi:MAG: tetratricopeptide repeat protein [Elusimicrobia bacterium]|nr:tetratricopeptide repeat protein [Elusimicrobiota bacterium]